MRAVSLMLPFGALAWCLNADGAIAQQVSWERTGTTDLNVYSLFVDKDGTVYASTASGLLRSTNAGRDWTTLRASPSRFVVVDHQGDLLVGEATGIYRSAPQARDWERLYASRGPYNSCHPEVIGVTAIAVDSAGTIFAGVNEDDSGGPCKFLSRLMYSSDRGTTWSYSPDVFGGETILVHDGASFVGVGYEGVFRSTDTDTTWSLVGLRDHVVSALVADSDGVLYAGTGGFRFYLGPGRGIYRSADQGTTWVQINNGIEDTTITALASSKDARIFAGTYQGEVYRSADGGAYWEVITDGLPKQRVSALAVDHEGYLYAGLESGIFRTRTPVAISREGPVERPQEFVIRPNYPNPFNPGTTIPFEVPVSSNVRLIVYDALGREVTILTDQHFTAGAHSVHLDGSSLSSGVYLVRAELLGRESSVARVHTRRVILLK